jgi:hypothetical protein
MSPTTTLEPTTHKPWRPRHLLQSDVFVLVAITVLALAAMLVVRAAPVHDRSLTFVNPTTYALGVEVSGPASGWLPLTTVDRESTLTVDHVFDQGDTWRVRFSGQALDGGSMVVTRADLEAAGWKITVPDDVGQRLAANGATPSPQHTAVPAR